MNMRDIPQCAVSFIKAHEACELKAYQDSAGFWTVGYGHIGSDIHAGLVIPQQQADDYLRADLKIAVTRLYSRVHDDVIDALTDNQYGALLSFVFNLGADAAWTIWKRLNAKRFDQVPGEMIKFVNAGGKKIQGLVNRRTDEIKLWSTDEPGSTDAVVTSSQTRATVTPPTPADPVPAGKSGQIIAGVTGVVAAVPAAASQVSSAMAPYAEQSALIKRVVAALAVIGAIAATVVLVLGWMKKREARG